MTDHVALFPTRIGRCAIAWRGAALTGFQLPASDDPVTLAHLRSRQGRLRSAAPPAFVAEAIRGLARYFEGEEADLTSIPLAYETVRAFDRRVLEATRLIPPGVTRTYGSIAESIGAPRAARAVGAALGRNPWPIIVPCHRVVAANGALTGFSAPGGLATKRQLLALERAQSGGAPDLFGLSLAPLQSAGA